VDKYVHRIAHIYIDLYSDSFADRQRYGDSDTDIDKYWNADIYADQHSYSDGDGNGRDIHQDDNTHMDQYVYLHCDTHAKQHRDRYANLDKYVHMDQYVYIYCHTHAKQHGDRHTDLDRYRHLYRNPDAERDIDGYAHMDMHKDKYADADMDKYMDLHVYAYGHQHDNADCNGYAHGKAVACYAGYKPCDFRRQPENRGADSL
jgi:hypothetical protein